MLLITAYANTVNGTLYEVYNNATRNGNTTGGTTQLTDVNGNNIFPELDDNQVDYGKIDFTTYNTTSPVRVGTWVDGKPIYRITKHLTNIPENTERSFVIGDNCTLLKVDGFFTRLSSSNILQTIPVNFEHLTAGSIRTMVFQATNSTGQINYQTTFASPDAYLNIYYIDNN